MSQTLSPAVISNPATLFAPSITRTLRPALISNPPTVYNLSRIVQGILPSVGIEVRVYRRSAPTALADILPRTRARRWLDQLSAPGSGTFEIHVDDAKIAADPTLLDYGNIIRFALDGVERFAFVIESKSRSLVDSEEHSSEWLTVSGRGVLSILEEAVMYPAGGITDIVMQRDFELQTAGQIFRTLLTEAQARGAITPITHDFTDSTDSEAEAFTATSLGLQVGENYLSILSKLAGLVVDVHMTPTLLLQMFEGDRGRDLSEDSSTRGAVILRPAHNITQADASSSGVIRNTLLVAVPGGVQEKEDADSVTDFGRREAFLSLGQAVDGTEVDMAAAAAFVRTAQARDSITIQIEDVEDHSPYVDFQPGDWVKAPGADGALARYRVRALTVTEDEEGHPKFIPELGTLADELEERFLRWLQSIDPGGDFYSGISSPVPDLGEGETGVFEPPLTGQAFWYKGDDLVGDDQALISEWLDASGGGFRLHNAPFPPMKRTNVVNGQSVARFDGTNDYIERFENPDTSFGPDQTMFVVFKAQKGEGDLDTDFGQVLWFAAVGQTTFSEFTAFGVDSSYRLVVSSKSTALVLEFLESDTVVGSPTSETFFIGAFRRSSGSNRADLWVNGTLEDSKAPMGGSSAVDVDWITIGRLQGDSQRFKGDVAEWLGYDRALTDAEVNETIVHLKNKYGIA